ncbi:hypothetical protein K504DRAFT_344586, partial [Pleomassaria siparia CBS 279.74]
TTSTAPYSSEGPTLPILGNAGVTRGNTKAADAENRPNKKRKITPEATTAAAPTKAKKTKPVQPPPTPNPDLAPLQKPWTLLPPALLEAIHVRLGQGFWEENCLPVVITRNQNIRSGVNKLKTYLGAEVRKTGTVVDKDVEEVLSSKNLVIAISAMGEATTKLLGVLEVLKRVVGGAEEKAEGSDDLRSDAETCKAPEQKMWYTYTALSSTTVHRKVKGGDKAKPKVGDMTENGNRDSVEVDDASFEPTAAEMAEQERNKAKALSAPVLTVWIARVRIPDFESEFGEQSLRV